MKNLFILLLVCLFSFLLFTYKITEVPPGINGDEAGIGYNSILISRNLTRAEKLDKDLQKRILDVLDRIRIRPHYFVKRLVGSPYFRLRVGDYRVVYSFNSKESTVTVVKIEHRQGVYK